MLIHVNDNLITTKNVDSNFPTSLLLIHQFDCPLYPSAPACLSVISPYVISTHNRLFGNGKRAKNHTYTSFYLRLKKILPTSIQGNYRHSLGEYGNTSYGMFGDVRVKNRSD